MSNRIQTMSIWIVVIFFLGCTSSKTNQNSGKKNSQIILADNSKNRTIRDSIFLETEITKKSQDYYEKLLTSSDYEQIAYDNRLTMIRNIANKLSLAMSYGYYNHNIHLVKNKKNPTALNAFVLPTGQIFIFDSLVNLLEKKAKEKSNGNKEDELRILEGLLAAVIGHEIGHYYGKHQLKSEIRKLNKFSPEEQLNRVKDIDLSAQMLVDDIETEQNYEIQSDWFAVHSMGKAGYNQGFVEYLLNIFKEYMPAENPYLSSHPSMNKRIAYITKNADNKKYLDRIEKLEYAFAAVETGFKLEEAAVVIKDELEFMPDNPHLLSALGKIYHRIWEKSCEISELRFKSSIIFSPFQEGMIHPATRSKEGLTRKFWCNQIYYESSLQYYKDAIKNFAGPYTLTSYAVLLSYHPNPEEYKAAIPYARRAFEEIPEMDEIGRLRALNNLGIVFFMNEKFDEAVTIFGTATHNSLQKLTQGEFDPAADKVIRSLSGRNTGILLEAFYNLGSVYKELSDLKQFSGMRSDLIKMATEVWQAYVVLDTDSQWGQYALAYLGSSFNSKQLTYIKPKVLFEKTSGVSGNKEVAEKIEVTVGDPVSSIEFLEKIEEKNNFTRGMSRGLTRGLSRGFSRGFSRGLTINVIENKLIGIRLDQSNSYPVKIEGKNVQLSVGMGRALLEEILGKPQVVIGNTLFYPNYFSIFQLNTESRVQSISIQEVYKK